MGLKESSVQTETETKTTEQVTNLTYPCFYCGKEIGSKSELIMHKRIGCKESIRPPSIPCYQCGGSCTDKRQLRDHYKTVHPEVVYFWCDFCYMNFASLEKLQCHIRSQHRDYLPS